MNLQGIADMLSTAPRMGSDTDAPEGNQYIQLSSTLATEIAKHLRNYNDIGTMHWVDDNGTKHTKKVTR